MDEELMILIAASLDEEASAQRIAAQLPNLARRLNEQSAIELRVSLAPNQNTLRSQAQQISRSLQNAAHCEVGVRLSHLDSGVVADLRHQLSSLGVGQDVADAMTQGLDNMNIRIDRMQAQFAGVNDQGQRLLNLTIQGTDAMGKAVVYLNRYRENTDDAADDAARTAQAYSLVESTLSSVTVNLEQQRQTEERASRAAARHNDERLAFLSQQRTILDGIRASYTDADSPAVVSDEAHIRELTDGYDLIVARITQLQNANVVLDRQTRTSLMNQITLLRQQAAEYRNTERAAAAAARANQERDAYLSKQQTSLDAVRGGYTGKTSAKPITDAAHLKVLEDAYDAIANEIVRIGNVSGAVNRDTRADLERQIALLQQQAREYQNVEYVATKLRTKTVPQIKGENAAEIDKLEEKLRSAGILTDSFGKRIADLRLQLKGVDDAASLTGFMNAFDTLNRDVESFKQRIHSATQIYTKLIEVERKAASAAASAARVNPKEDPQKYASLISEMGVYEDMAADLRNQASQYDDIRDHIAKVVEYENLRIVNTSRISSAQADMHRQAQQAQQAMQAMPASVQALESRFRLLLNPSEELTGKVRNLRVLMAQWDQSTTEEEKVAAFHALRDALVSCNREVSAMLSAQRVTILDSRTVSNIEKAKADLATIRLNWSKFTKDKGLSRQFDILQRGLSSISTDADFRKWTAQFGAFKSEVRAAGMNVKTFGDQVRSNLAEVTKWMSATQILFKAIHTVGLGIETIINLDTAMIDLRKTTTATQAQYQHFYEQSNETAKRLGSTTEAVIAQTAEWSRLGYTLEEASDLAQNSAIFAAVSPEMTQEMATDGLISAIKAFEIDANDAMDAIISKVNSVGNAFAVSNADIVEVLTRSSSAMSAANNTFDETVALATAAVEITRDAASVGNGLKTLSMRIRGYDEETEEYSEDVAALTGTIADLTKTASRPGGISLFEKGDPDTYRSTYAILQDISTIFDEISDKDQAKLLEALFGKRQAQIGAAILSNFEQAESAIETMANSAGSAEAEMENIYGSIEYKLNRLGQTWVGVAQNILQTDDIGMVVDFLTMLSGAVDVLTQKLGLLGTVSVAGFGMEIRNIVSTFSGISGTVESAVDSIVRMGDWMRPDNVVAYASALNNLTDAQQQLVYAKLGLSDAEGVFSSQLTKGIGILKEYDIALLEQTFGLGENTIAHSLNMASHTQVTDAILKTCLANGVLTKEQIASVAQTNRQTSANAALAASHGTAAASMKAFGATMKATFAAMATNPMTWISLAIALIPQLIAAYDDFVVTQEEAYAAAEEMKSQYEETSAHIQELGSELETTNDRIKELQELERNGTITLIEQQELDRLQSANAELLLTIERERELLGIRAQQTVDAYKQSYDKERFNLSDVDAFAVEKDYIESAYGDLFERYKQYEIALLQGKDINEVVGYGVGAIITPEDVELAEQMKNRLWELTQLLTSNEAGFDDYVNALIDQYNTLVKLREEGSIPVGMDADSLDASIEQLRSKLVEVGSTLTNEYILPFDDLDVDDAALDGWRELSGLINRVLYPAEWAQSQLEMIPQACYAELERLGKTASLTAIDVESLAERFPELSEWMAQTGYTADDVAAHFNSYSTGMQQAAAQTSAVREEIVSLSEVHESYASVMDIAAKAQAEMVASGRVSQDTIIALSKLTDDYTDYLYEENGAIRLNIGALRSLAEVKYADERGKIEAEIQQYRASNDLLRERIQLLEGLDRADYSYEQIAQEIALLSGEIEENNDHIREKQKLLSIYSATQTAWGDALTVYNAAAEEFSKLADVQQTVSDGYEISAEAARKLAGVYPEVLQAAVDAGNGQIRLDSEVVSKFIEGKRSEVQAAVDAEIQKLTVQKTALAGKLNSVRQQLEAVRSADDDAVESAAESAAMQMAMQESIAAACEQAGIDEEIAVELATLAMAGDWESFETLALNAVYDLDDESALAFANIMGNFSVLARNVSNNTGEMVESFSRLGEAISNAMEGRTTSRYNANISVDDVNISGKEAVEDIVSEMWTSLGTDRTVEDAGFEASYAEWKSKLQGVISEYARVDEEELEAQGAALEKQIASVESQIAALTVLRDSDLLSFGADGSGSSGGGSSEVEEYIADIDQYREALEALRQAEQRVDGIKTQRDNTSDLKEQILLSKMLIQAYGSEQEALENLNRLRDQTISAGVHSLRELGFVVEYNAEADELWIDNMERINELTATSVGEYDSMQEATNALRKETEELIGSITDLNNENRESAGTWQELEYSIGDARGEIDDLLDEIVGQASDAVDSMQDVYETLHAAADEYAQSGYITIDTLQKIIDLGIEYLAYLRDENGQLVINEERIQAVIAAKTQQLAVESALSYVESLTIAKMNGDVAALNQLLYATQAATDATWGLVYARLAISGLDAGQQQQALSVINAMRSLADSAVMSIGQVEEAAEDTSEELRQVADELGEMEDGLNDILDYTMDMLRDRIEEQIDGLEGMKDAYSEIVELQKESIELKNEEVKRQKTQAEKMRELAKLQKSIDLLELDDSREAHAERVGLLEEMAKLQSELEDDQAEYSVGVQTDALDKMEEAYIKEKDAEIAALENSISSTQKLYDMAISYIGSNWATLRDELISWNYEIGNSLESELVSAWDAASAAVQRYGSFVSALSSIGADREAAENAAQAAGSQSSTGGSFNTVVGETTYDSSYTQEQGIAAIVRQMYENSQGWHAASEAQKQYLSEWNLRLGEMLNSQYGLNAYRGTDGHWYVDGQKLFEKYRQYCFHDGGIVGGGGIRDNEQISLLKDDEWVLSEVMVRNLKLQMDRIAALADAMTSMPTRITRALISGGVHAGSSHSGSIINNSSQPISISFGDVVVHGAGEDTVESHVNVSRQMVNDIARILRNKM